MSCVWILLTLGEKNQNAAYASSCCKRRIYFGSWYIYTVPACQITCVFMPSYLSSMKRSKTLASCFCTFKNLGKDASLNLIDAVTKVESCHNRQFHKGFRLGLTLGSTTDTVVWVDGHVRLVIDDTTLQIIDLMPNSFSLHYSLSDKTHDIIKQYCAN